MATPALWAINIGLALKVLLSILPIGFLQTLASFDQGYWYARSAQFMQTPLLDNLKWLRVIGDTIFAIGALALGWFDAGPDLAGQCTPKKRIYLES